MASAGVEEEQRQGLGKKLSLPSPPAPQRPNAPTELRAGPWTTLKTRQTTPAPASAEADPNFPTRPRSPAFSRSSSGSFPVRYRDDPNGDLTITRGIVLGRPGAIFIFEASPLASI